MIDHLNLLNLRIFRLPVDAQDAAAFEDIYRLWHTAWIEASREMAIGSPLVSDALTRQHEVLALYEGDRPIACVCHRYAELRAPSTLADSFFQYPWTEQARAALNDHGQDGWAVLGSQITVDRAYRKSHSASGIKFLISFLSLEHAQRLGVDVILGRMRVDKGMDKVFYQAGAITLDSRVPYHGTEVDLVAFYPKRDPVRIPAEYQVAVSRLLKGKVDSKQIMNPTTTTEKRRAA